MVCLLFLHLRYIYDQYYKIINELFLILQFHPIKHSITKQRDIMFSLSYYQLSLIKSEMIRDNHQKRIDGIEQLQYRNALYQGEAKDGHFQGGGFVYFHDDNHLITCKNFERSCINGPTFFIYDRANYHFGEWKDNNPNGVSVFRIKEAVIVAQYKNGSISFGSKIVILIEDSNVGVVVELMQGGKWRISQKREVYCMEHIQCLIQRCNFSTNQTELSLFRFISHRLNNHPFQLRLVGNHYKFGFEDGLTITFDEQEHIIQINARKTKQVYERSERSQLIKAGQVYSNAIFTANESNFRNKALKDPSKGYFDQFSRVLDEGMIKCILSGFIMDPTNLSKSRNSVNQKSLVVEKFESKMQVYISPRSLSKINKEDMELSKGESYKVQIQQTQSPIKEVGNSFAKSKIVRQPVKLYSFQQSPNKKQPNNQDSQLPFAIPTTTKKQQDSPSIQFPQTPQKTQKKLNNQSSSKGKIKIFEKSPIKKDITSVAPQKSKDRSHSRTRQHRIFPSGQTNGQPPEKEQSHSIVSNKKPRADSPILALKSEALKSQKSKQQILKRQATDPNRLNQKLQTINRSLRAEFSGKKRTLTEFESDGEILSEDMSNLLDVNSTLQINEAAARKLGKHNNIYRNQGKDQCKAGRKQMGKVKSNDNSPYIAQAYHNKQGKQLIRSNMPMLPPKTQSPQLRYQYF